MTTFYILAGFAVLAVSGAATAFGRTATDDILWMGRADGQWEERFNWRPEAVPNGKADKVIFGKDGFGAEGETRTVRIEQEVTVGSLKFANTSGGRSSDGKEAARNYVVSGPGRLVFDNGKEAARLEGNSAGTFAPQHRIEADMQIASPLIVLPSPAQGRDLVLSGSIRGKGAATVEISIVGRAARVALSLSGENDFQGGAIRILEAAHLKLDSAKAARGAEIKLEGEGDSGIIVAAETLRNVDFDLRSVDVIEGGAITVSRRAVMYSSTKDSRETFNWADDKTTGRIGFSSITIRAGRKLRLLHSYDTQIFVINPGHEILLEAGSNLEMAALQRRRNLTLCIGNGALLRGAGTVTCEAPPLNPEERGSTSILIDAMGGVAPGTANSTGILYLGNSPGETDNTVVRFEPQSELRIRLNGLQPGNDHDQVVLRGKARFEETKLEIAVNHRFTRNDRVYPIVCEGGEFRGDFINAPDGGAIELNGPDGALLRARVSYFGDAKTQATTGGKDLVIYDFH